MREGVVLGPHAISEGPEVLGVVPVVLVTGAERRGEPGGHLEVHLWRQLDGLRTAPVPQPVVHRQRGHERPPVVALDGEPRGEVRVLAYLRTAEGAAVAVGG